MYIEIIYICYGWIWYKFRLACQNQYEIEMRNRAENGKKYNLDEIESHFVFLCNTLMARGIVF